MEFITISSGFSIPKNNYYNQHNREDDLFDEVLERGLYESKLKQYNDFLYKNGIYVSNIITQKYKAYNESAKFDAYMDLLDISIEILKGITLKNFVYAQVNNKFLTDISFSFCMDLLTGDFANRKNDYLIVPFNLRLNMYNELTKIDMDERKKKLDRFYARNYTGNRSWEELLSNLFMQKELFPVFFRYLFVDFY